MNDVFIHNYEEEHNSSYVPSIEGKEIWFGFLVSAKDDGGISPKEMMLSLRLAHWSSCVSHNQHSTTVCECTVETPKWVLQSWFKETWKRSPSYMLQLPDYCCLQNSWRSCLFGFDCFFCLSHWNITFQSYLLCFPIKLHQILYVYNCVIISKMQAVISKSHEQVLSSSKIWPE